MTTTENTVASTSSTAAGAAGTAPRFRDRQRARKLTADDVAERVHVRRVGDAVRHAVEVGTGGATSQLAETSGAELDSASAIVRRALEFATSRMVSTMLTTDADADRARAAVRLEVFALAEATAVLEAERIGRIRRDIGDATTDVS